MWTILVVLCAVFVASELLRPRPKVKTGLFSSIEIGRVHNITVDKTDPKTLSEADRRLAEEDARTNPYQR